MAYAIPIDGVEAPNKASSGPEPVTMSYCCYDEPTSSQLGPCLVARSYENRCFKLSPSAFVCSSLAGKRSNYWSRTLAITCAPCICILFVLLFFVEFGVFIICGLCLIPFCVICDQWDILEDCCDGDMICDCEDVCLEACCKALCAACISAAV